MNGTTYTIREATHKFVQEMNTFPLSMISILMENREEEWCEVTKPAEGDTVQILCLPPYDINKKKYDKSETGGIILHQKNENNLYTIELFNDAIIQCDESVIEVERESFLPMWGTLWQFNVRHDDWWLENEDGIQKMSDCGFRIYYHNEFGYFFGIDGVGYDFYNKHWIPLYKARGLQWHNTEIEEVRVD